MRTPLARRYRRLLLCYPRAYRRERGEEIVATLLELAGPGRAHPTGREAVNLVRHGLRCRLGRPTSRSVAVWASLASVLCGLFAAALATRAAWETAPPLPSEAETAAIFASAVPDHPRPTGFRRSPALFVVYEQPLGLNNVDSLLFGDGGEYQFGVATATLDGQSDVDRQRTIDKAGQGLRAEGWQLADPVTADTYTCVGPPCDPATIPTETILDARRGADILELTIYPDPRIGGASVALEVSRATPWAAYPAGAAGFVLGAVLGWLAFGWASRRTEVRPMTVGPPAQLLWGFTVFLWGAPVLWAAPYTAVLVLRGGDAFRWPPLWEWLGQSVASLLFLAGCTTAACALLFAAWPLPKPARDQQTAGRLN